MHFADGDNAFVHVGAFLRVRLVEKTFIAFAGGARFVGVNPGDDDDAVFDFFLDGRQAGGVVHNGLFIVCGAGADDHQKFAAFAGEYVSDLGVPFFF